MRDETVYASGRELARLWIETNEDVKGVNCALRCVAARAFGRAEWTPYG
jgi:hypothetical protein